MDYLKEAKFVVAGAPQHAIAYALIAIAEYLTAPPVITFPHGEPL